MSPITLSLVGLVVIFALTAWRGINLGTLAFPGALLVGSYAGLKVEDVLAGFPVELFMVVAGITYLFAIAQSNGTIDQLLSGGVSMLRGEVKYLPVLLFLVAFGISAIGPVAAATVTLLIPVAMTSAYRYGLSPFMAAMITLCGVQAGYFSPIAIYSVTVRGVLDDRGHPVDQLMLFLVHLVLNLVLAVLIYLVFGRSRSGVSTGGVDATTGESLDVAPTSSSGHVVGAGSGGGGGGTAPAGVAVEAEAMPDDPASRYYRWATLAGLGVLAVGIVVTDVDPGLLALSIGAILMIVFAPKEDATYVTKVAWPTCFMLAGVLTYVAVMQEIGTFDTLTTALTGLGGPVVGVLLVAMMTGFVSIFASSIGTMATTMPLLIPLLEAEPSIPVLGAVSVVTAATYLVDANPLNLLGALTIGNSEPEDRPVMFRKLVVWATLMAVLVPPLTWALMVLPWSG